MVIVKSEEVLIIYTHPPPFNEISPCGEMGVLTKPQYVIARRALPHAALRTPSETGGKRKRHLSIPTHHPFKVASPKGEDG